MSRELQRVAALLIAAQLAGAEYALALASEIAIDHAWVAPPAPGTRVAKGYLSVRNRARQEDRLLKVETTAALKVMVRMAEGDSTAMDAPVVVPPGEALTFAPGRGHLLFLFLSAGFGDAGTVPATLVFERAGRVEVLFKIETVARGQSHDGK